MSAEETEYLAAHVHDALTRDPRVNEPELQVTVVKGRVHVTGMVPTQARHDAVTDVVHECCPELEVENRTTVARLPDAGDMERMT